MPSPTTSKHPRRRARRALLAALLPAALAAALPAAAQATTVELSGGTLSYRADSEKTNTVAVRDLAGVVEVRDLRGLSARGVLCTNVDPQTVRCGLGTQRFHAFLGDRDDSITVRASFPVDVDGGSGADTYIGAFGPEPTQVRYFGGAGLDSADYDNADRSVSLSNDNVADDGRTGFDRDEIALDMEILRGAGFADKITTASNSSKICCSQIVHGGAGDDQLRAVGSAGTVFVSEPRDDGADRMLDDGSGPSTVSYGARTAPVTVTPNFGGSDDGQTGEDDATFGIDRVVGSQAGDRLRAFPGSTAPHSFDGGAGDDTVEGADGADSIVGGPGEDTILAHGGADLIFASDGFRDIVGCGSATDTAELDSGDGFTSCENRRVGVLRLAPKGLRVEAGKVARLRLSWRHPRSWRRLRRIELRLVHQDAAVGTVTIRPRGQHVSADGVVKLSRRSRFVRKGKTVSARLWLRVDRSLAGRRLRLEVEAVDARGARQLERRAGAIRVAG